MERYELINKTLLTVTTESNGFDFGNCELYVAKNGSLIAYINVPQFKYVESVNTHTDYYLFGSPKCPAMVIHFDDKYCDGDFIIYGERFAEYHYVHVIPLKHQYMIIMTKESDLEAI